MPTPSPATASATGSDARPTSWRPALLLAAAAALVPAAGAQAIFTCTDASGKRLTSDRPIPECRSKEQGLLHPDGSKKGVVAPTPTAEEQAEMETRRREAEAALVARNEAIRRDRNLVNRFPDEASHAKAREKALDDVRKAVRISEERIALLKIERKPLMDEAEFYVGKSLPGKLKQALDANDAALEAQKSLVQNQQTEVNRLNALYDLERARLKKLWAGAPAGSLGPANAAPAPNVAAPASRPVGVLALRPASSATAR